mmetsp:Transcript_13731/g.39244  ORF Transcript_13731/g.39244 Transcript_13731/m.39244 type:complete len:290 (+) Transcript_13731:95-964(+)
MRWPMVAAPLNRISAVDRGAMWSASVALPSHTAPGKSEQDESPEINEFGDHAERQAHVLDVKTGVAAHDVLDQMMPLPLAAGAEAQGIHQGRHSHAFVGHTRRQGEHPQDTHHDEQVRQLQQRGIHPRYFCHDFVQDQSRNHDRCDSKKNQEPDLNSVRGLAEKCLQDVPILRCLVDVGISHGLEAKDVHGKDEDAKDVQKERQQQHDAHDDHQRHALACQRMEQAPSVTRLEHHAPRDGADGEDEQHHHGASVLPEVLSPIAVQAVIARIVVQHQHSIVQPPCSSQQA